MAGTLSAFSGSKPASLSVDGQDVRRTKKRMGRSRSGQSIANRLSEHRSTVCTTDILSVESSSRNFRFHRHRRATPNAPSGSKQASPSVDGQAISAWHARAISAWHEFGSGAGALRARKSAWHRAIGGDEVDMLATDKMSVVQREGASCGFEEGRGTDGKPNANDQERSVPGTNG